MSLNVLWQKVMKETEASKMKIIETETQCAMKQRGTRWLSCTVGKIKKMKKSLEFTFFSS